MANSQPPQERGPSGGFEPEGWRTDFLVSPELFQDVTSRRVIAYFIDLVVLGLVWLAAWILGGLLAIVSFGILTPVSLMVLAILPVLYSTFFVGYRGATPGMGFMDLEVVTLQGERPDYLQALILILVFYVSVSATFWLVLLVVLFNDRRRTLHDFLAGTLVLRTSVFRGL